MTLLGVRIGAVALALIAVGLLLYKRQAVAENLRRFFLEPTAPTNLAILRFVLFGGLARVSVDTSAVFWAAVPPELRFMPPGWRWLHGSLPLNEQLAQGAQYVVVLGGLCAASGLLTRVTAPITALVAVYLLGVPSFFGKILHMDHALVLMALVVSASPCGDALSLDRLWLRRRGVPPPGPSTAYTLPIRLSWLLLGTIYLFPGLWKVWNNGDLWLSGERLLWELRDEWGQRSNFNPPMRIDEHPWLLKLLGASTLIFEVGIFFAIFNRYTRIAFAFGAVAFHIGVRAFLGIKFYALVPLVLLIDFPTFGSYKAALAPVRSFVASAAVGCLLLAAQTYVGLAQIDTWPVALHPKFDERKGGKLTASSHQLVLEQAEAGEPEDIGRALVGLGAMNGYVRLFLNVDRDIGRG
ncbi:MAG TPA: hypothetical protein VEX18_18975, partial [Polyangiaceae bacterium]|nr:hypothetical protein [Polyangiaceae bacterium]